MGSDAWGPSVWDALHLLAYHATDLPAELSQPEGSTPPWSSAASYWSNFLFEVCNRLPCYKCRVHFGHYLTTHLRRGYRNAAAAIGTRERLVAFLNDAHNEINRSAGKPEWSLARHKQKYATFGAPQHVLATPVPIGWSLLAVVLSSIAAAMLANRMRPKCAYGGTHAVTGEWWRRVGGCRPTARG